MSRSGKYEGGYNTKRKRGIVLMVCKTCMYCAKVTGQGAIRNVVRQGKRAEMCKANCPKYEKMEEVDVKVENCERWKERV